MLECISSLPEKIDKNDLADFLLIHYGNMTPRYNTTQSFMFASKNWFKIHKKQIEHYCLAVMSDYLPFEEFNTSGEYTDDSTRKIDDDSTAIGAKDQTGDTEHKVSADNEPSYQPRSKDTNTEHEGTSNTLESTRNDKYDNHNEHSDKGHNKSNQLLALEEVEVSKHNVYEWIGEEWSSYMCINVW